MQSHFVYPPVSEHGEYSIFAIVNNTAMSTGTEVLHSFIFYQQKYLAEKSDLTENITLGKYYLFYSSFPSTIRYSIELVIQDKVGIQSSQTTWDWFLSLIPDSLPLLP